MFRKIEIICFLMGMGWDCGCLSSLISWVLCFNCVFDVVFKLEVKVVKVFSLWYCERFKWRFLVIFFIVLICVVLLIWDIDILMLMVGWMFWLNRLVFRKYCLLVIEMMLVGM